METAAVIKQVGKVELMAFQEAPPYRLRSMSPTRMWLKDYEKESMDRVVETVPYLTLTRHRMVGLSVNFAYWPDSWQEQWAVDELLEWEWPGWKNENRNRQSKYYADFIVDENQQANPNELRALESKSVRGSRGGNKPMVLVVHESVPRRSLDARPDASGGSESNGMLRLV